MIEQNIRRTRRYEIALMRERRNVLNASFEHKAVMEWQAHRERRRCRNRLHPVPPCHRRRSAFPSTSHNFYFPGWDGYAWHLTTLHTRLWSKWKWRPASCRRLYRRQLRPGPDLERVARQAHPDA
ncbi:MAG TPA: hypothetical protein VHU79_09565, partial [Sphingomicrobium sp.]|nr:hypothetical protein [Sphingomicrobium sp.]